MGVEFKFAIKFEIAAPKIRQSFAAVAISCSRAAWPMTFFQRRTCAPSTMPFQTTRFLFSPAARLLRVAGYAVMRASGTLDGMGGTRHRRERQFDTASSTPVAAGADEGLCELGSDDHLAEPFRRSQRLAMLSKPADPATPDEHSVLDANALARLAELDPNGEKQLLARVLQAFKNSVARLRPSLEAPSLETPLPDADRAALRLVAHTLKSSSASIGALRLSQLCAQIEASIRLDPTADLSATLGALNDALDGALIAIDELLKDSS